VFGDHLHLTVPNADVATPVVREFLKTQGIESPALEKASPSMEDIFVESMGHER
jgi:hypothetical protein